MFVIICKREWEGSPETQIFYLIKLHFTNTATSATVDA